MLLRLRVMPVARLYISANRALRSMGSSEFAFRLEKALQGAIANESVVEGLLLGLGAAALCSLLSYSIYVLIYCQVGFFVMAIG